MRLLKNIFFFISTLLSLNMSVNAQYGRLYVNVPRNYNYLQLHYYNTISNSWAEQSIPNDKIESITNLGSLSFTKVVNLFGRTGGPGIVLPYSSLLSFDKESDTITNRASGFGDPSFTFDCNIFGAPSLRKPDYDNHIPKSYMSAHYVMGFPLGNYDETKSTNIGANRYTYKFTLNYSITTMKGLNWIDMYASVKLSGKNKNYLVDKILSQDPVYGFEFHYSQDILGNTLGKHFWINLGAIYSGGGKVSVDGIGGKDLNSVKLCGAVAFPTWKHGSVILSYNGSVWSTEGSPKTNQLVIQINCPFFFKPQL